LRPPEEGDMSENDDASDGRIVVRHDHPIFMTGFDSVGKLNGLRASC